jgi:hypothetical protein
MPNQHSTLTALFTGIANAIREKDGTSAGIIADTFPDRIRAIVGGGDVDEPLPEEYQEVEYIQTDGTAYIDTGYSFSGDAQFDFETLYAGNGIYLLGATDNAHVKRFIISASNNLYDFYGTGTAGTAFADYNVIFNRDIRNEMIRVKGVMRPGWFCCFEPGYRCGGATATNVGSYAVENTIYFLAQRYGTTIRSGAGNQGRRFYIADWNGSKYVAARKMRSCYRKSDGVIGMYDLAHSEAGNDPLDNNFFINAASSGAFTKGADVFPSVPPPLPDVSMMSAYAETEWTASGMVDSQYCAIPHGLGVRPDFVLLKVNESVSGSYCDNMSFDLFQTGWYAVGSTGGFGWSVRWSSSSQVWQRYSIPNGSTHIIYADNTNLYVYSSALSSTYIANGRKYKVIAYKLDIPAAWRGPYEYTIDPTVS